MKITMYELLGMVKDGKAPKKIEYGGDIWEFNKDFNQYQTKKDGGNIWNGYNFNVLNYEVEILEEEKEIPEKLVLKLDDWTTPTQCDIELSKKIDEIIDYLKSKGE